MCFLKNCADFQVLKDFLCLLSIVIFSVAFWFVCRTCFLLHCTRHTFHLGECELQRTVSHWDIGSVLQMLTSSTCLVVLCRSTAPLFPPLCHVITLKGMLPSPTTRTDLSIFLCSPISLCVTAFLRSLIRYNYM